MNYTVICGYRATKRSKYCPRSFHSEDFLKALAEFADHCVRHHSGRLKGVIVKNGRIPHPIEGRAD